MARPVILWLQQAFRRRDNAALVAAVEREREEGGGLVVLHGLDPAHPLGSPRVNRFLMECALETLAELEGRGAVVRELPASAAAPLADQVVAYVREARAAALVVDDPATYMPAANLRRARRLLGEDEGLLVAVEANTVVPTRAYGKAAVGAYALRRHIQREAAARLQEPEPRTPTRFGRVDAPEPPGLPLSKCRVDMYGEGTRHPQAFDTGKRGGESAAAEALSRFVDGNLATYGDRKDAVDGAHHSDLSAFLHFGALSPRVVAWAVLASRAPAPRKENLLEQLLVRRELSFNAARFLPTLRSLSVLPEWARATLTRHDGDRREHEYALPDWEGAKTHDALWNATQLELRHRGTVHSYMRMLWGKKIIEWSASHEEALRTMETLNGAWAYDGRGATMWANHLWCFGLHDRAFAERPVFGKVRWMSSDSTRRKFDVDAYVEWTRAGCPPRATNTA